MSSVINPQTGKVYLVGAGPGDPGLLTMRGADLLRQADVVVYDRLANPVLLALAPAHAEHVYVGKHADNHILPQDEINVLLIERARAGKTVVRLKGGDPFVFGRGGEEAEALKAAGVGFEIVPGVTSAIAVPAYAGIPVTHRDDCSAFAIVTGHEDPTKPESQLDYAALAKIGTLIFLMGVGRLDRIAAGLIEAGMSPDTPVAVAMWGSTPRQKCAVGTLTTIHAEVKRVGITPPALTIVGTVVRLRETLRWFDDPHTRPLFGQRVLVTRSRAQASDLVESLRALGAEPVEFPVIAIAPPADNFAALDRAIARLNTADRERAYDWVVFTSVNGVEMFWQRLRAAGKDARSLASLRLAAIGPATAEALAAHGLVPDVVPAQFVAESLLAAIPNPSGQRFLLPRADIARAALREGLLAAGALVDEVETYRTTLGQPTPAERDDLLKRGVDILTFTSSSTVRNFVQLLGPDAAHHLAHHALVAAIGPITARTARDLGLRIDIEAPTHTIPGLLEALITHHQTRVAGSQVES
jgi:uroporphyrinogen III methyltransferase/synthase